MANDAATPTDGLVMRWVNVVNPATGCGRLEMVWYTPRQLMTARAA